MSNCVSQRDLLANIFLEGDSCRRRMSRIRQHFDLLTLSSDGCRSVGSGVRSATPFAPTYCY